MANLSDLQAAIDSLLAHPQGPGSYDATGLTADKAYEAYIFGLCLRAVRNLGAQPVLCGISGTPNPFVFRGKPGRIYSAHRNYGYATFNLNGEEFEIHLGVEFMGCSGMTHELDVSIIKAAEADKCRRNRRDPKAASLIGGWECKFYGSPLQKHLARSFVGLVDDLGRSIRLTGFCSNQTHPQMPKYFQPPKRPYPHLLLSPDDPSSEIRFVETLSAELKKMTAA